MKRRGIKADIVVKIVAVTGLITSSVPSIAASLGECPSSI